MAFPEPQAITSPPLIPVCRRSQTKLCLARLLGDGGGSEDKSQHISVKTLALNLFVSYVCVGDPVSSADKAATPAASVAAVKPVNYLLDKVTDQLRAPIVLRLCFPDDAECRGHMTCLEFLRRLFLEERL